MLDGQQDHKDTPKECGNAELEQNGGEKGNRRRGASGPLVRGAAGGRAGGRASWRSGTKVGAAADLGGRDGERGGERTCREVAARVLAGAGVCARAAHGTAVVSMNTHREDEPPGVVRVPERVACRHRKRRRSTCERDAACPISTG